MSDYATMSETNGRVNNQRRYNRLAAPWLQAVIDSPIADSEAKEQAKAGLDCIAAFDSLLCRGYVSTGYQYDDFMCERDERNDTWQDNAKARNGSTAAEEAEAEIAFAIASRRAGEAFNSVKAYFSGRELSSLIPEFIKFPGDDEPCQNEFFMSLSDWIDEGLYGLQCSDNDDWQD